MTMLKKQTAAAQTAADGQFLTAFPRNFLQKPWGQPGYEKHLSLRIQRITTGSQKSSKIVSGYHGNSTVMGKNLEEMDGKRARMFQFYMYKQMSRHTMISTANANFTNKSILHKVASITKFALTRCALDGTCHSLPSSIRRLPRATVFREEFQQGFSH